MKLGEMWHKLVRYMNTRKCVRAGHPWCTEDGPLPDECPQCIAEFLVKGKSTMKKYLFLLAWVQDSEGASGDDTNVNTADDLLPEYKLGSEYVFAYRIIAPNSQVAGHYGYAKAFHENYTGYDTVSTYMEIDGVDVPDNEETPLITVDFTVE